MGPLPLVFGYFAYLSGFGFFVDHPNLSDMRICIINQGMINVKQDAPQCVFNAGAFNGFGNSGIEKIGSPPVGDAPGLAKDFQDVF